MLRKEVGSYKILQKIGQGGMGIVYKAIHTKLEQEVAIKVLHPQFSQDPQMRKRFVKEAKIQARFTHPNVVNILNCLEDEANIFLVMECVNGETLENKLKREGSLTPENSVSISLGVLEALGFMHSEGVVHRDIKPGNIMFTEDMVVKVTDFGIAKVIGEESQTKTSMVGTFRYMSPEQILGEETTMASDIYSFGITLYEMVTGRVPFRGDSEYKIMKGHLEERPIPPWEINGNVPKKLGRVILKALSKDPRDRQKIGELQEDIKASIKKSKGLKIFSEAMDFNSWKEASVNSPNTRLLLSALGILIFVSVFWIIWIIERPKEVISGLFAPGSSQQDIDLSKVDESNPGLEFLILPETLLNDSAEEISKFDDLDGEMFMKTGGDHETLGAESQPGIYTEREESKNMAQPKGNTKNGQIKKKRRAKLKQPHTVPTYGADILFPQPEVKSGSKWKIRK